MPLRRWIKYELKDLINEILSEKSVQSRGLFNPRSIKQLILDNESGRCDASYTIFSLLCIEIWCRKFIDQGHAHNNSM